MATLSDTPTQTLLISTSEAGGVSIKIEQGVLPESDGFANGSGCHSAERWDIQTNTAYESNTSDMKNFSNGMGGHKMNDINLYHSIFEENIKIKAEPSVDIDDRHPEVDEEVDDNNSSGLGSHSIISNEKVSPPKIRLTPTSKLIATPSNGTDSKRRYACPYENCTKSYGKSSHLRSHLTWHTGIKPFGCKEPGCGKSFTRSDELNRHIRTHTGEKPFECIQCAKKFSRSDHLTKHLATHTKQLAAANKLLTKKTKSYQTPPQTIVKTNSPVTVPVFIKEEYNATNNSFINNTSSLAESDVSKVVKEEQNSEFQIKLENTNYDNIDVIAPKWERPELSSSFAVQSAITNIKMEPGISVKSEPLEENPITGKHNQFFEDEPDDDAIMPEANLPPLMQNAIPTSVETPVNSPIKKEVVVHDPTRPHSCTKCTKSFKRQDDLNRHMRTHTGEKPFACTECDKRFMRSDHLKKHVNTHIRMYRIRIQKESPTETLPPSVQPPGP